jgi:DNA gyrase/topoisomerase IV subunit A
MKARDTNTVTIEEEMKRSYLEYAMSVIVGRTITTGHTRSQPGL